MSERRRTGGIADLKLAGSSSFTEGEVHALDELLATLRRGGDARGLVRGEALLSVAKKLPAMRAQIERNRSRRMAG